MKDFGNIFHFVEKDKKKKKTAILEVFSRQFVGYLVDYNVN